MQTLRPDFFFFDLGNVLLYFDHGIALRRMAKVAGVTYTKMHEVVLAGPLQHEYETGLISGAQFVNRISESIGKSLDSLEILQAAADMFVPNPHILPVLKRVRAMGIPTGLLSNTCEAHWEHIVELGYPQVAEWFSPIVLSYEVQSMKPDRGIYLEAQKLSGCEHERIFFTDDREDNIEAARSLGWQAEVFINADRLMHTINGWDA